MRPEAKLQLSASGLKAFYGWLDYCVQKNAIPGDMTSWSWDSVHQAFRGEQSLGKHHGIWNVGAQLKAFGIEGDPDAYFNKVTWIHAPPIERGGRPANLSHPIIYVVTNQPNKDLAAMLVALASQHVPNTRHAVTTNHTPIKIRPDRDAGLPEGRLGADRRNPDA